MSHFSFALQAAPQAEFLNSLGVGTINYDLLGCGDSPAPRPDSYEQLLQTYSPEASFADLEQILQTMTKVQLQTWSAGTQVMRTCPKDSRASPGWRATCKLAHCILMFHKGWVRVSVCSINSPDDIHMVQHPPHFTSHPAAVLLVVLSAWCAPVISS